jgi:hypothetical protein
MQGAIEVQTVQGAMKGCETFGDLGLSSRRHTLEGVVGVWDTEKCDRFLIQVALYNKGLQRNGGKRYYQA